MENMRTLGAVSVFVTIALLLGPGSARAAVCTSPFDGSTFVLAVAPGPEGFFAVHGELVNPCTGGAGQSGVVTGTAHLRPDGKAHLGLSVAPTSACGGSFFEAILDPPSFSSGVGQVDTASANFFQSITYTPASCPALIP
jgi:hypothetical protein